jgi:tRNA pseudouridine13 synthase
MRTTEEVARLLADAAGVRPGDVGYAGRKDLRALATQWLSVPGLDPGRAVDLAWPGVRVLEAARHPHKLRTGQLRGNEFRILVRELDARQRAGARARFAQLAEHGMPNRYGPQRFGRDGANLERAARLLRGEPLRVARREARFLVSALQSAVFNDVLDARPLALDRVEAGEVALVHASGGLFVVADAARECQRCAAFEISATGPIFGTRVIAPGGAAARREATALAAPLRLRFALPAGSYATVLLRELLDDEPHEGPIPDDTARRSALCSEPPGS